ncbi:DNA-processing protein DprA [Parasphingorhabdus sp.]|uniref:DNA-processing protein DprA n=1 Tax=Parasphingorhabdus sp. TaxID=2709688 RepID=UPI003264F770
MDDAAHADRVDRLQLIRSANIGPVSYARLLKSHGSASSALKALPELARRGGPRAPRIADRQSVLDEMAMVAKLGAQYLFRDDPAYPVLLSELDDAPPVLICRGDLSLLERPTVAIVGARNASAASCRFARDLANDLGQKGVAVVSGLARGIDTAAHDGSINQGTIGVIAGGTDIYFPPENQKLQEAIADRGLLLSEQPPGTEPRARHFPYRNRIIAGLARGTVVVEAAPKSGSLITARLAGEAGRQVMAIPGSPIDPRSRGCNSLIRDGAVLIQCAEDVMELVRPFDERIEEARQSLHVKTPARSNDKGEPVRVPAVAKGDRHTVEALLSSTPVAIDELVRQTRMPLSDLQLALLELELSGRLTRSAGARVSLAPLN